MSGDTPSGSPEGLRPVTSRKLLRLIPARRTPVGASWERTSGDMCQAPSLSGGDGPPGAAGCRWLGEAEQTVAHHQLVPLHHPGPEGGATFLAPDLGADRLAGEYGGGEA